MSSDAPPGQENTAEKSLLSFQLLDADAIRGERSFTKMQPCSVGAVTRFAGVAGSLVLHWMGLAVNTIGKLYWDICCTLVMGGSRLSAPELN